MDNNQKNIKLSFLKDKTKFFINEKRGIVTCIVESNLKIPNSHNIFIKSFDNDKKCKIIGVGIAKCHKDDIFDVECGKKIALAKAENNAYLNANAKLKDLYNDFITYINGINAFDTRTYRCCAHNCNYIDGISFPNLEI